MLYYAPPPVSIQSRQAAQLNSRGVRAAARGDTKAALDEFRKALKLNSATENLDGTLTNLLNITRLYRLKGDTHAAWESVRQGMALAGQDSPLYAEFSFEYARLQQSSNMFADAEIWARKALSHADEGQEGKYLNLLARLLFQQNREDEAAAFAAQALAQSRTRQNLIEAGYALRTLGDIELAKGRHETAMNRYQEALDLHKRTGISMAIADDLEALARTAELSGDAARAAAFRERSRTILINSCTDPDAGEGTPLGAGIGSDCSVKR